MPVPPKFWLRIGALPVGLLLGYSVAPREVTGKVAATAVSIPMEESRAKTPRGLVDPANEFSTRARILAYGEALDNEALAEAAKSALRMAETEGDRRELVDVLVVIWASADPVACIEFCASLEKTPYQISEAFGELAAVDHLHAIQLLDTISDAGLVSRSWDAVLSGMLADFPSEAIALAKGAAQVAFEATGQEYGDPLKSLFYEFARIDPERAAAALLLENPDVVENQLASLAAEWAKRDPQSSLAWVMARSEGRQKRRAVGRIIKEIAAVDPELAAEALAAFPEASERMTMVGNLAAGWALRDPAKLQEWAATLSPTERGVAMGKLVGEIAMSDVEQAKALALSLPEGDGRLAAQAAGIDVLKRTDPFAAAAWYAEASGGKGINIRGAGYRTGSVVDEIVREDPGRAFLWALELGGTDALNIPRFVIGKWMERDPDAVARAMEEMDDGKLREHAVANYGAVLAGRDPGAALGWADTLEGREQIGAFTNIASMGGNFESLAAFDRLQDLATSEADRQRVLSAAGTRSSSFEGRRDADLKLAEWVRDLEWPELQARFAQGMMGRWGSSDLQAAGEWLDSLPAGTGRDAGVDRLAQSMAARDPAGAWGWAVTISDSAIQRERVASVAESWAKSDRAAAVQAVVDSRLSDQIKAVILEKLVP